MSHSLLSALAYKFCGAVFTPFAIHDPCTVEHILIDFLHPGKSGAMAQYQVRNHCTSPASLAIEKKAESLLASSLAGESASRRLPSERTTIRSLSMMVLSLWAMVMMVQWRNSFLIVAWMRSSVSRSIAAVASSKTITLLCLGKWCFSFFWLQLFLFQLFDAEPETCPRQTEKLSLAD